MGNHERLIDAEQDPDERDRILCCHMLLTGHDRQALNLYGTFRDPDMRPNELQRQQEIMADREAQVCILLEQYRLLANKHQGLRTAYIDLKDQLDHHVIIDDDLIEDLRRQIGEIDQQTAQIPRVKQQIEDAKREKERVQKEIEDVVEQANETVAVEVELKTSETELKKDIAGVSVEKEQLEKINDDLQRKCKDTEALAYSLNPVIGEFETNYAEIQSQFEIRSKQIRMLDAVHARRAAQVKDIWEWSQIKSAAEFFAAQDDAEKGTVNTTRERKELKKECERLVRKYKELSKEEEMLRRRIAVIKENLEKSKKRDDEFAKPMPPTKR
jgi:DNA repair exonuclease SbcCD ATPase subunit